jgi:sensor histidine kinase YesM
MLQPLVENAIRHGIGPRATGGRIEVQASRQGDTLKLRVHDDGIGMAPGNHPLREGTGIGNIRARLRHLYGARHSFSVGSGGDGFTVEAEIPFHVAAESELDTPPG